MAFAFRSLSLALGCAMAATAFAAAASESPQALQIVLAEHLRALGALHARRPQSLHIQGSVSGLGLDGSFESWREGDRERYDETLGIRAQRTLRIGGVEWVRNANGDVRELRGIVARRQITEDTIDSGDFARHPEYDTLLGRAKLRDGRDVWQIRVEPPGGDPFGVAIDAATFMIDEKAYVDGDGVTRFDYSDYRVTRGALYPTLTVESNGEAAYDVKSRVTSVAVDEPIADAVFAPLEPAVVDSSTPVVVPLMTDTGHYFVRGSVAGKPLLLLIDSGSQGLFLDAAAAQRLGLSPEGTLEVRGSKRIAGRGVAALDRIDIGGASLPAHVVSVVDLNGITYKDATIDGVLGYPFFAAAEIRIDPDAMTMTIARPGTLAALGTPLPIDTDRELPEVSARINGTTDGRFLVDTGNNNDLLVFHTFVRQHPGVVFYGATQGFAQNRGVGGSTAAVPATVYRLQLGPFNLYNRYADVMLSNTGAFADGNEAGNIGLATLKNFIFTFDYAGRTLYLQKARGFDDGRYRPQYEHLNPAPPP
ncbi:MAG: retropepsin-like aspartic protease [Candidatus Tumulicola sp.]